MNDTLDKTYYELPEVVKYIIASYIPSADLAELKAPDEELMQTHQSFFKPLMDVRTFLDAVVNCEHDKVKTLLKDNIDLLLQKSVITDGSRRNFEPISGLEYTLWSLDKHMWTTILKCIPQNEAGKKVSEQLSVQYDKVKTQGITYMLNGEVITESHFDFQNTLIKELQIQVGFANAPGEKDWDAIDTQWKEGVGSAQRLLPVHVINEYCSPTSDMTFNSYPESSKQFYDWVTDRDENWVNEDSKLGVDLGIHSRAAGLIVGPMLRAGKCGMWTAHRSASHGDLVAITALCNVRTNDFINLESQLKEKSDKPLAYHFGLIR